MGAPKTVEHKMQGRVLGKTGVIGIGPGLQEPFTGFQAAALHGVVQGRALGIDAVRGIARHVGIGPVRQQERHHVRLTGCRRFQQGKALGNRRRIIVIIQAIGVALVSLPEGIGVIVANGLEHRLDGLWRGPGLRLNAADGQR